MDVSARSLVLPQVSYGTWCCYGISSKWLKTLERCRVNLCSRWQWIWLGIILCAKPEWVYIVVLKITLRPFVYSRHTNRIWKVIFGSPFFLTIFFWNVKEIFLLQYTISKSNVVLKDIWNLNIFIKLSFEIPMHVLKRQNCDFHPLYFNWCISTY